MDISLWQVIGSLSLGAVVGLVSRYFFEKFNTKDYNAQGLAATLACLIGGTALAYLSGRFSDPVAGSAYPAGLLLGILLAPFVFKAQIEKKVENGGATLPAKHDLPTFTILEIGKTLTFVDRTGHRAIFRRYMKVHVNQKTKEMRVCTVSADGTMSPDIKFEGTHGAKKEIITTAGQTDIHAHFPLPLEPGTEVEIRIEYDLIASFPQLTEFLGHDVQHQTKKVGLVVEFSPERPCIDGWCAYKYAGDMTRADKSVKMSRADNGLRLSVALTELKIGEEYRLSWSWPK